MPNSTNNSPRSCLSALCWGRGEAKKMKGNLCSVKAQRLDSTKGPGGCVNAAQRRKTTEQEDIPSLALSSLLLAVFWHWAAVWLLRAFPRIPARLCSPCDLWPLCTSQPSSTWTAPFSDSLDTTSQWNLWISKANTAAQNLHLWISWPLTGSVTSMVLCLPSCAVFQDHELRASLLSQPCCGSAALVKFQTQQTSLFGPPSSYHAGVTGPSAALPLKSWNVLREAFCSPVESTSALDHWSIRGTFVIPAQKL